MGLIKDLFKLNKQLKQHQNYFELDKTKIDADLSKWNPIVVVDKIKVDNPTTGSGMSFDSSINLYPKDRKSDLGVHIHENGSLVGRHGSQYQSQQSQSANQFNSVLGNYSGPSQIQNQQCNTFNQNLAPAPKFNQQIQPSMNNSYNQNLHSNNIVQQNQQQLAPVSQFNQQIQPSMNNPTTELEKAKSVAYQAFQYNLEKKKNNLF